MLLRVFSQHRLIVKAQLTLIYLMQIRLYRHRRALHSLFPDFLCQATDAFNGSGSDTSVLCSSG